MYARPFGIAFYAIPFKTRKKCFNLLGSPLEGIPVRFATFNTGFSCKLVDMELHAIAKIAAPEQISLISFGLFQTVLETASR